MTERDPIEEISFLVAQAHKEANGRGKAGAPDHFLTRLAYFLDVQVERLRREGRLSAEDAA